MIYLGQFDSQCIVAIMHYLNTYIERIGMQYTYSIKENNNYLILVFKEALWLDDLDDFKQRLYELAEAFETGYFKNTQK